MLCDVLKHAVVSRLTSSIASCYDVSMSRLAALLILVAALTGTPLRQAEAAGDLGRSLRELVQPANMEEPDGGVGDDSGVGTLSTSHAIALADPFTLATPFRLAPTSIGLPITAGGEDALRERVWCPSNPPNCRHAWLQIFLF